MANAPKGRVVICTGSREFDDANRVKYELELLETPSFVIHGGQRGADRLVSDAIHEIDGLTEVRLPYLRKNDKRGGHIRNSRMVELGVAMRDAGYEVWGIAFHFDIEKPTPGTAGMVRLLNAANFSVIHIDQQKGLVKGHEVKLLTRKGK